MSKIINKKQSIVDLENAVMEKIRMEEIKMKPKWLFVLGSLVTFIGLISLTIGAVFLVNLTTFLIRKRGPGYGKLQMMLESFPIWVPILAIVGIVMGIWILRKYEFSYKKNFLLVIATFILSVIAAGILIDQTGLNNIWSHKGPMKRFYEQVENPQNYPPRPRRGYPGNY